jgi:hypothetical protein
VLWHLSDAWHRRAEEAVILVHYDDLVKDLNSEMRRLADLLGITVSEDTWPGLVEAASFQRMRARAPLVVPDPLGVFKDKFMFFRRGTSGSGGDTLTRVEVQHYHQRVARMAPPDLLAWLHRDSTAT